jgi:pSer/pThr/pTyr-binding forkhead associated (FHA) protein
MDVKLVVDKGRTQTRSVRLHAAETIVGRRRGANLRIASAEVSRRHCVLHIEEEGYLTVEDLDSANGTFLNGAAITGREVVRPGDHLKIGPLTFVVEYQLTQAAIDHLRRRRRRAEEEEEVVEVVEDEAEAPLLDALADDEETATQETPVADEDWSVPEAEESAEVVELEEGAWDLPQEGELRDILSKLDEE